MRLQRVVRGKKSLGQYFVQFVHLLYFKIDSLWKLKTRTELNCTANSKNLEPLPVHCRYCSRFCDNRIKQHLVPSFYSFFLFILFSIVTTWKQHRQNAGNSLSFQPFCYITFIHLSIADHSIKAQLKVKVPQMIHCLRFRQFNLSNSTPFDISNKFCLFNCFP